MTIALLVPTGENFSKSLFKEKVLYEETLTQGLINSIYMLKSGKMAIGTEHGFNIYDGEICRRYYQSHSGNGLSGKHVYDIVEDRDNNIWLATEFGLNILNPRTDKFKLFFADSTHRQSVANAFFSLALDSAGMIWCGNAEGMIVRINPETGAIPETHHLRSNMFEKKIADIVVAEDGTVWAASNQGTILSINPDSGKKKYYDYFTATGDSLSKIEISALSIDSKGAVWVSSYESGVAVKKVGDDYFRDANIEIPSHPKGLGVSIRDLAYYPGDSLIVATTWRVFYYDLNTEELKLVDFLPHNPDTQKLPVIINTCLYDRNGNFWLGLNGFGVYYYYDSNSFMNIYSNKTIPKLTFSATRGIFRDKDGTLYVGGYTGFDRILPSGRESEELSNSYIPTKIDIHKLDTNLILFSTANEGLITYNKRNGEFEELDLLHDQPAYLRRTSTKRMDFREFTYIDSSRVLIATYRGAFVYDLSSGTSDYIKIPGRSNRYYHATSAMYDSEGRYWIATDNGTAVHPPGTDEYVFFSNTETDITRRIVDNMVNAMIQYGDTVYLSTGSGVEFIDVNSLTVLPRPNQPKLNSRVVTAVLKDQFDQLWIATYQNLFCYDTANDLLYEYTINDGTAGTEFNRYSYFKADDGTLYFGGLKGVTYFNQGYLRSIDDIPLYISEYYEYNEIIRLDTLVEYIEEVRIAPEVEIFSFRVSAVNLENLGNIAYKYRLTGEQDDFIRASKDNMIHFAEVPPGRYKLEIKAFLRGQEIGEITKTVIVEAKYYETVWFKALLALAVLLTVAFMIYARLKSVNARTEVLKKAVEEKTAEISESNRKLAKIVVELEEANMMKNKLLSIVSHDIKNPISLIQSTLELTLGSYDILDEEKIKEMLHTAYDSTKQLYFLQQDLFNWGRSMGKKYNPDLVAFNLTTIVDSSIRLHKITGSTKGVAIENNITGRVQVYSDPQIIGTVVRNLISNAIKFTESGGKVSVDARKTDKGILLEISDTGIGFDDAVIKKIKGRQAIKPGTGTGGEIGTGLGLTMSLDLLDKPGIPIDIESEHGVGTKISVLLPDAERDK